MSEKPHLKNSIDLHPDNINWAFFLENHCQLRDSHNDWKVYNSVNCFYFVDPEGYITTNYGYHAQLLWNKFKGEKFFDSETVK